jgi:hypothetical protein
LLYLLPSIVRVTARRKSQWICPVAGRVYGVINRWLEADCKILDLYSGR